MQVLKPVPFDVAQVIATNAVELYPAWSSTITYAKDARVDYGVYIYESLVNSNLNKQPDISPTEWLLVGADNKSAMFDPQVSTQTTSPDPLIVTVRPGKVINSLAFLNLVGNELEVSITDGVAGPVIYSNTVNLDATIILDWYMYFFEEFNPRTDVVLTDIPAYLNAEVTMTLNGGAGEVKIGGFVYGTTYDLGLTQYGVSSSIIDYSVKQTDDFGNTTFVQRAFSKRMEANVFMQNNSISFNQRLLSELRATPVVWIGSQEAEYESLVVYGFYREFNIDINYPTYSMCRITIEGLT